MDWSINYFLIIFCVFVSNTDCSSSLSEPLKSTYVQAVENQTVLLPCLFVAPTILLSWQHDGVRMEHSIEKRIHLNGSLELYNVRLEDSGEYICETSSSIVVYDLEIQVPPSVRILPKEDKIEIAENGGVWLECHVEGSPLPHSAWYKNKAPMHITNEEGQRIYVEIPDRYSGGVFECSAINGVGEQAASQIVVNVLFSPDVKTLQPVVHTRIGERATLECIVESSPQAKVHWFHEGLPVQTQTRSSRYVRQDSDVDHPDVDKFSRTRHTLQLRHVIESTLGVYECRAENRIGFRGVRIELTGRPKPCVFKSTSATVGNAIYLPLIWETESPSPVLEYKLRFRRVLSGDVTPEQRQDDGWMEILIPADKSQSTINTIAYTLHGLRPGSVYELSATARNRYGWSDSSVIHRAATAGHIDTPSYYSTEPIETLYDHDDNVINDEQNLDSTDSPYYPNYDYRSLTDGATHSRKHPLWSLLFFAIYVLFNWLH